MTKLFEELVRNHLNFIGDMLVNKNEAYGNSALDPVRIFSDASPVEQLKVRIDDKLSRIARGGEWPGEDTIDDLIGYLILLKLAHTDAVFSQDNPKINYGKYDG